MGKSRIHESERAAANVERENGNSGEDEAENKKKKTPCKVSKERECGPERTVATTKITFRVGGGVGWPGRAERSNVKSLCEHLRVLFTI